MIDVAKIKIEAGDGGDGKGSFRRELYIPKGGPDGGDGGKGGSVYLVADHNMATLVDFHAKPVFKAIPGEAGGSKKMSGGDGVDLYVKVPVGTLVYEITSSGDRAGELLVGDLSEPGQTMLIARGGIGGKGNFRFRSSKNQTPLQYTEGTDGEKKDVRLEIKLMADIGLIGLPNAGKSTLINMLTRANARVANYPFTTLEPNLGTLTFKNGKTIVIADIPGLIEGASEGKGLGDEFLRHVERTRLLVHIIDAYENEDVLKAYDTIRQELRNYSKDLEEKPEITVINKIDITEVREGFEKMKKDFKKRGVTVLGISAATGEGIDQLRDVLMKKLDEMPEKKTFALGKPVKTYNIRNLPNRRMVFGDDVKLADWGVTKR